MRLIAREASVVLLPELAADLRERSDPATFPSTEIYPIDFSLEALQRAVKEDAADKSLPIADRAQALLIDAMVDYGHQRYQAAMAKYELLRQFFAYVGHAPMLALVLNSIGEVFARVGMHEQAQDHFERAITPAVESKSYPVLLNVSLNLGNLHLAQERWDAAAEHYTAADALATQLLNAHVKLACMENVGVCKHRMRDYAGAQKAWTDGATLAKGVDEPEWRRRFLVRLRELYREANMRDQARALDDELGGPT
jgi:tetratricopeptide (TPR) repeat protein